jgi:predicted PurR-regulated permease PerM
LQSGAALADQSRHVIDIAPAAIAKVIAAIVLIWLWLHLWQLLMIVVVALVVAIGLEPAVEWLERRRLPRSLAATTVVVGLTAAIVVFFWVTGSSLAAQAKDLGGRLSAVQQEIIDATPPFIKNALSNSGGPIDISALAGYVVNAGRLAIGGAVIAVLVLILTLYLLIEGAETYTWLVAYVPPAHRDRVHTTAAEAHGAIYGYVVGNVATSVFATVVVLIALSLLHVPAALLLALLAGVFDFVPVLGFICSAVPALLVSLGVSPATALAVAGVYVGYHLAENYYIGPKVYGDRLRLSNLAVIIAFAVGAEIGGVGGALLALPVAALYPVIERVWLKEWLSRDAVETHRRLAQRSSH